MYRSVTTVYLLHHMPSAHTMLKGYQAQISASRGAGMAGVGEQARLAPTVRALLDVVNDDYDPRGPSTPRE
jgi:hypothetical protein